MLCLIFHIYLKKGPILGFYQVVTLLKKTGIKTPVLLVSANTEEFDLENYGPFLGLRVGCCYRLSTFGDLGIALFSSKDGRTAVDVIVRRLTLLAAVRGHRKLSCRYRNGAL